MTLEGSDKPSENDHRRPASQTGGGLFSVRTFALLATTVIVGFLVGVGAAVPIGMTVGQSLGMAWGLLVGLITGVGAAACAGIGILAALHAIVRARE